MRLPTREEIIPEKEYFIFSTKWTNPKNGRSVRYDKFVKIWFQPNNTGYTYDLAQAGRYTGAQILESFDYYCNEGMTYPMLCEDVLAGKHGTVMQSVFN